MPAKSISQQGLMGIVHGLQKGTVDPSDVSKKASDIAFGKGKRKAIKKKDAKDFASTKHTGLPQKVSKESIKEGLESEIDAVLKKHAFTKEHDYYWENGKIVVYSDEAPPKGSGNGQDIADAINDSGQFKSHWRYNKGDGTVVKEQFEKIREIVRNIIEKVVREKYDSPTFNQWFDENKNSSELKNDYQEYVHDMKIYGVNEKPLPFNEWAKERFDSLHEITELIREVSRNAIKQKYLYEYKIIAEVQIKDENHLMGLVSKFMNKDYQKEAKKHLADVQESMVELWKQGDIKTDQDLYGSIDYLMNDLSTNPTY